jgi:hypothetical protein
MHAHKLNIIIPDGHEIAIRLPDDFPAGPAEVSVLATRAPSGRPGVATRTLEPHPVLGKIVFHEDPSLSLEPEDRGQAQEGETSAPAACARLASRGF